MSEIWAEMNQNRKRVCYSRPITEVYCMSQQLGNEVERQGKQVNYTQDSSQKRRRAALFLAEEMSKCMVALFTVARLTHGVLHFGCISLRPSTDETRTKSRERESGRERERESKKR